MRMPPWALTPVREVNPFELLVLSRDQARQVLVSIERGVLAGHKSGKKLLLCSNPCLLQFCEAPLSHARLGA